MKWKNEIYEHEVTPPHQVWNRISHDLENELIVFKDRLHHIEVTPPENNWDQILNKLDAPHPTKVRYISIKKVIRIAAAAAIIGIAFFTANYFITDIDTGKTTGQKIQPAVKESNPVHTPVTEKAETPGIANPETGKTIIASNTGLKKAKIRRNTDMPGEVYLNSRQMDAPSVSSIDFDTAPVTDRYNLDDATSKRIRNLKGEIREDVRLMDLPNSYFYMTGPNGQSVRVSSKFRNTIQYLNGSEKEEMLDVILRESRYWRDQFKTWKEKVGTSTFIPSADNFMDISELMKLLQHNDK
ncbi:MAG: hypothetical protein M9904_10695 [Chitinophagaceae bacterium]|nr:hypothetical protein [Chitinophagaceae bacterium]